jgi:hypothetical protein
MSLARRMACFLVARLLGALSDAKIQSLAVVDISISIGSVSLIVERTHWEAREPKTPGADIEYARIRSCG